MDKETKALIDFYDNRIKDLENQNKEKQDKLDQCLKELKALNTNLKLTNPYNRNIYTIKRLDNIINIIKGEDK